MRRKEGGLGGFREEVEARSEEGGGGTEAKREQEAGRVLKNPKTHAYVQTF